MRTAHSASARFAASTVYLGAARSMRRSSRLYGALVLLTIGERTAIHSGCNKVSQRKLPFRPPLLRCLPRNQPCRFPLPNAAQTAAAKAPACVVDDWSVCTKCSEDGSECVECGDLRPAVLVDGQCVEVSERSGACLASIAARQACLSTKQLPICAKIALPRLAAMSPWPCL